MGAPYSNLSVNLSLSPCEDATSIGYDEHQINRLTVRMSQYWLSLGTRLIFGHDWRDDGVMQAIAEFTEAASSRGALRRHEQLPQDDNTPWRLLNVVAVPHRSRLSQRALRAEARAAGLLKVMAVTDLIESLPGSPEARVYRDYRLLSDNEPLRLLALRHALTELLAPGIRICLGGKTSGYSGYLPGVAEEAYFALRQKKPLYLIGGFGGATRAVAMLLTGDGDSSGKQAVSDLLKQAELISQADLDRAYGLREGSFASWLQELGIEQLGASNGLTADENHALFETTDLEFALSLISEGVGRLYGETSLGRA